MESSMYLVESKGNLWWFANLTYAMEYARALRDATVWAAAPDKSYDVLLATVSDGVFSRVLHRPRRHEVDAAK
jgi:hypothetical protein